MYFASFVGITCSGSDEEKYCKIATIHLVTTMPTTSKNVLFPGCNHLLTTGTDDPTLCLSLERQRAIKTGDQQVMWLCGYGLEIRHF